MASITKRGKFWRVQVWRRGIRLGHTFDTKSEAQTWAAKAEADIGRGVFVDHSEAERTTVAELLDRYEREVLPHKRSQRSRKIEIARLKKELGHLKLAGLTSMIVASYRDKRLKIVAAQTVRHDLSLLSRALKLATKEWGIALPHGNPVLQIDVPKPPPGRDRVAERSELRWILRAAREHEADKHSGPMGGIIRFALRTAMRRGEIANMRREDLGRKKLTLHIPQTKNGSPREIPLSPGALRVLTTLPARTDGGIWNMQADSITRAFDRILERARKSYEARCAELGEKPEPKFLRGIRFHDLRHTATTWLARLYHPHELARITGHKTLQMVMRYYHPKAEDLGRKMRRRAVG